MRTHLHVIPVRPGETAERTWDELCNVGVLSPPARENCQWASMRCDGEECHRIAAEVV